MKTWQYSEIKTKVQMDLDLQDESFIQATELQGYCNEAIEEAEAEICKINEDYFLASTPVSMVTGTSSYSLPSDIYISKVRNLVYANGTEMYEVTRIRRLNEFTRIADTQLYGQNDYYRYILTNPTGGQPTIQLLPASRVTGSFLTLWYIRSANRVAADTDVIDIPEFASFIMQFMKVRCYEKEGHPNLQMALAALESERKLMVDTLTEMVPDDHNEIERDLSHYWDHT